MLLLVQQQHGRDEVDFRVVAKLVECFQCGLADLLGIEDDAVGGRRFVAEPIQGGSRIGDDEDAEPVSMGSAAPLEAWIGVDFPCNSLLIIRFEWDDLGTDPFRIDYELIPSSSDR